MKIPFEEVPLNTLNNMLEEIVSRDGTDYGHADISLTNKVEQAKEMLKQKKAYLSFDEETETCNIIPVDN